MRGRLVFLDKKRLGHFERRPLNFLYPYTWLRKKKRGANPSRQIAFANKTKTGGRRKKKARKEKEGEGRNGKEKEESLINSKR